MDHGGPLLGERAGERIAEALRGGRLDRDAEGARERGEVRLLEIDREGLAVRLRLILAQDSVATVVDEQELRRKTVLAGCGELLDAVEKAAVADDPEDRRTQG